MSHSSLFTGLLTALLVGAALGWLAFRPASDFPRGKQLAPALPANLDEWHPMAK